MRNFMGVLAFLLFSIALCPMWLVIALGLLAPLAIIWMLAVLFGLLNQQHR